MGNNPSEKTRHTVDDHMFGDFYAHDHDGDADHDHDDIDPGPLEENPIWQRDNVKLTSVGIDIGSAGTQVIFSTVHLQRVGSSLASKYVIVDRMTAFESDISFTPFADETTIDAAALGKIIDDAYYTAGILPADIDAGVVILTGEALRRENSEAIAEIVAEKGGDFVTATAGNHMEAMLAAYGSGAAKASHDAKSRIMNIDIGGGTTKLALCESGRVIWTGALHIGGRLIATENNRASRIDPAGRHHARQAGYDLSVGDEVTAEDMAKIASSMSDLLVRSITEFPLSDAIAHLFLTELPEEITNLDGVIFSGGVGEYVSGNESRYFNDLGLYLGQAIRKRADAGDFGAPMLPATACIRATALGASEYSVQLSGQTSTITAPGKILPRRNMQVLKPYIDLTTHPSVDEISTSITKHFEAFDVADSDQNIALVFEFRLAPEYAFIRKLADGIAAALSMRIERGDPLYLLIDGDIAHTLGGILREEMGVTNELLVLDGLSLRDFDFIDLGKIRLPSFTVPVTVKSLLFAEDPRGGTKNERIHFRSDAAPAKSGHSHVHSHSHSHDHGHSHSHDHKAKAAK